MKARDNNARLGMQLSLFALLVALCGYFAKAARNEDRKQEDENYAAEMNRDNPYWEHECAAFDNYLAAAALGLLATLIGLWSIRDEGVESLHDLLPLTVLSFAFGQMEQGEYTCWWRTDPDVQRMLADRRRKTIDIARLMPHYAADSLMRSTDT